MRYTWIDEYLLGKAGVAKDLQKDWNWIRYQIGGKMFAAVCLNEKGEPYYITLKLEPMEGDFWRQQYEDIIPGYYMNKIHWNSIKPDGEVPDDLLKDLLDKSYQLVLGGFSKKKQREILEAAKREDAMSCCGTDCSKCGCFGNMCQGCNASLGKVFHAPKDQACPIYECAANQKGMKGCGTCSLVPCEIWRKTKDPAFTEEEFSKATALQYPGYEQYCLDDFEYATMGGHIDDIDDSLYTSPSQSELAADINLVRDEYLVKITTCSEAEFESCWDEYMAALKDAGVEKIHEERVAYFTGE